SWSQIEPYATNYSMNISGDTVYARFRDRDGNWGGVVSDTITLVEDHKADLNDDGVINMPELMAFIARWKANDNVTNQEVEEVRDIWFNGGVY
ncbi:MAG: hypothetical protein U9M95_03935, partial [Candidatus Altiarchaeota archaeon]|nr:hypothetical protein [Candidatus Altiarchaeota archaeon]